MTRRDAIVAALLSISLVALLAPFAGIGVDMHHDGIMLKPALDVLSGQVLFRDTFMQYGALTCYLQVLALWIYPSLLFVKLQTVVAYGVTLFFLYASWRLILPRSLTVISCCLFILFIPSYEKNWFGHYLIFNPWSSVFAMMFQSIGLYALFRVIRGEQPWRWGVVLGMACACVYWCRQPVGLVMTGCVAVIWLALHWTNWAPADHSKRSILVGISGGFVVVNVLLLGGILISGALPEWWYQNYIWPLKWAENLDVSRDDFFVNLVHFDTGIWLLVLLLVVVAPYLVRKFRPVFSTRSTTIYFLCVGGVLAWQHEWLLQVFALREGGWTALFPCIVLMQAVISVTQPFISRDQPKTTEYYLVAALAALSLGSLLQYYPIPDSWHVLWSLAPTFGLVVFAFWHWVGWRASTLAVALAVAFLPSLWTKAQSATQVLAQPLVTLVDPAILRGMKVPPNQARNIGQIMDALKPVLRYQPDIPSALIGNDAMFLCFTNNHINPSPYFVTWLGLADKEENRKRWNRILSVRPLMFLHKAKWDAVDDFYRRAQYVPLLYIPEEALEIAAPQELTKVMGRTPSGGAVRKGGLAEETLK